MAFRATSPQSERIPVSGRSNAHVCLVGYFNSYNSYPFKGTVRLELALPRSEDTSVRVFDPGGRMVREVLHRQLEAGRHPLTWDGLDSGGRLVASGVYFLEVRAGDSNWSRRIHRVK